MRVRQLRGRKARPRHSSHRMSRPVPVKREKCPFTWPSADGEQVHSCKYLEGHEYPHECECLALYIP